MSKNIPKVHIGKTTAREVEKSYQVGPDYDNHASNKVSTMLNLNRGYVDMRRQVRKEFSINGINKSTSSILNMKPGSDLGSISIVDPVAVSEAHNKMIFKR